MLTPIQENIFKRFKKLVIYCGDTLVCTGIKTGDTLIQAYKKINGAICNIIDRVTELEGNNFTDNPACPGNGFIFQDSKGNPIYSVCIPNDTNTTYQFILNDDCSCGFKVINEITSEVVFTYCCEDYTPGNALNIDGNKKIDVLVDGVTISINANNELVSIDTTYSDGAGIRLIGTVFDQEFTIIGSGDILNVEQTPDGIKVTKGLIDYNGLDHLPDLSVLANIKSYPTEASFPATGTSNVVYIAEDTGFMFRWNGSSYTQLTDQTAIWGNIGGTLINQIDLKNALNAKEDNNNKKTTLSSPNNTTYPTTKAVSDAIAMLNNLALGITSTTAYRGDRGKIAYDHSQITGANPHSTSLLQILLSNNSTQGMSITIADPGLLKFVGDKTINLLGDINGGSGTFNATLQAKTGTIALLSDIVIPSAPDLDTVVQVGGYVYSAPISFLLDNLLQLSGDGGFTSLNLNSANTSNQTQVFQDASGTIALLSDIPVAPSLNDVLTVDNRTLGRDIRVSTGDNITMQDAGGRVVLSPLSLTSTRSQQYQDKSGTIALLSDIPAPITAFVIGVNFQSVDTFEYITPEKFKINTIDNPDSLTNVVKVNGSAYTLGITINVYDKLTITTSAIGFLRLNCEEI